MKVEKYFQSGKLKAVSAYNRGVDSVRSETW